MKRREFLEGASDKGMVHVGTYNSNPLVMAAVVANLGDLSKDNGAVYKQIGANGMRLRKGLVDIYKQNGWPARDQGPETVFSIMLYEGDEIHNSRDYYKCDIETLDRLRTALRARGVYTRPSLRDIWYISTAHTAEDIDRTLEIAEQVVPTIERKTGK